LNSTDQSIGARIQRSLARIGLENIEAVQAGEGHVMLTGQMDSPDDRSLARAVATVVAGVTGVTSELS
jgi:osmotically-inducible protein OsmY